jgi:multiple sugar transport system substrate-binding protein
VGAKAAAIVEAAIRAAACLALAACAAPARHGTQLTISGSAVGVEGEVLRAQLRRFERDNPGVFVTQRRTPDAADQRHQLYVQWLNAHARDPDVLQLDVVWTPELAAAGWLRALDAHRPDLRDFFQPAVEANRWRGRLYAVPWFVDVGLLYYRSDVLPAPPRTHAELVAYARRAHAHGLQYGLLWQAARYEGLVTVFTEYLAAFGGAILDAHGRVVLESSAALAALEAMRSEIAPGGIVPRAALSWQEEQTRFAFQNGHALLMRNWPYAYALMQQPGSRVRGRFGVSALPAAPGGRSASALGGSQLAVSAFSDQPQLAYRLIAFLTEPAQMLERARVAGELPARRSLYATRELASVLPFDAAQLEQILSHAVARPATPVYAELSDILQVHLHRCLSGQENSARALHQATREIEALFARVGLAARTALGQSEANDG